MFEVIKTYLSPARVGAPAAPRGKAAATTANTRDQPPRYLQNLILLFVTFKTFLLIVAASSPGLGYDTSTDLLFESRTNGSPPSSWLAQSFEHLVLRLTRWDGIYYASIAERGYVHEQEWAFGGAMGRAPVLLARVFFSYLPLSPIVAHALASICLSHFFHLGAVLALFSLTSNLLPEANRDERNSIAFTAACLHIISPGGLFLSAAYVESIFAFFSFVGMALYVSATRHRMASFNDSIPCPISTGVMLGLAAATRSNGLFNGIIPAWDALILLIPLMNTRNAKAVNALITTIISGSLIGLGFVGPQTLAYVEYCTSRGAGDGAALYRPWCSHIPPSVYQWVQHHYWNVGLFKYWTPNNIPLFALAAPMLALLVYTAVQALWKPVQILDLVTAQSNSTASKSSATPYSRSSELSRDLDRKVWLHCLPRLVIPQLLLTGVTVTTSHVQIVNRLSSAYPVWYVLLAVAIHRRGEGGDALAWLRRSTRTEWVVRGMILYAVVQGALFASFLPPA